MRMHSAEGDAGPCESRSLEERITEWEAWAEREELAHADKKSIVQTIKRADDPLHRAYLIGLAERHEEDPRFLADLFMSYNGIKAFPLEKRQNILGYLSRKANRQLVKQLSSLKRLPRVLNDYVAHVDELPSVGRRGQIRMLVKLADLQGLKKSDRSKVWRELKRIVTQRIEAPPDVQGIIELLHRHDDFPAGELLSQVFTYFQLSGRMPKLRWLKRENYRLAQKYSSEEPALPRKWLNKTGKRKLRDEIERKLRIARFEAFDNAINRAYYGPLTTIIGQELPARFFMSPELLRVISAYNKMPRWRNQSLGDSELFASAEAQLRPIIENLLRAYVTGSDAAIEYLASLPGNKALGNKIKRSVLKRWREGYAKSFEIGRAQETRSQDELTYDYGAYAQAGGYGDPAREHADNLPSACGGHDSMDVFGPVEANDFGEVYDDGMPSGLVQNHFSMHSRVTEEEGEQQENLTKCVRFYDAKDPIEAMQMGEINDTLCTRLSGGEYAFTAFVNAIDGNKKVVYMADSAGKRIGRTLCVLTRKGLIAYDFYTQDTAWDYNTAWMAYFAGFAKKLHVPLIVVDQEAQLDSVLEKTGAKNRDNLHVIIDRAVCSYWYDNAGSGQVEIPAKGLSVEYAALVLPLKKNKVKV